MNHRPSREIFLLVWMSAAVAFAAPRALSQSQFGTIKGRLVWGGRVVPPPRILVKKGDLVVKDCAVCAAEDLPDDSLIVDPQTRGVANGFACVVDPIRSNRDLERKLVETTPFLTMEQKGCRYIPRVLAIHKDQALVFRSGDPVAHNNNFRPKKGPAYNWIMRPGDSGIVSFNDPEPDPVPVRCDIHPWTSGIIMVFDHPFFALTKADGSFEVTGVPAGTQRFVVRHEDFAFATPNGRNGIEVEVKPGGVTDIGEIKLVSRE